MNIYDFKVLDFNMNYVSLSEFKGKVLLVVNTATSCVLRGQFKSLEKLYAKYKDQGFEVLAFPSHNFLNLEHKTGRNLEVHCRVKMQLTYPIFKRIHVKGKFVDPLYAYLSDIKLNGNVQGTPKWNFHKYLVNRQGEVVDFFYPTTSPLSPKVCERIEMLLDEEK